MRIWGIDGGGTKTDAVICDEGGRVLRRTQGGPSNCSARPMEQVLSTLTETIRTLTAGLSGADAAPDAIFAGISGAGVGDNAARIRAHLQALFPQCPCIQAGTDAKNALRSAIPAGDGAIAIAGTGSGVFVFRGEEMQQIGGWGYLLGDEGSGFDLGRRALKSALRARDGRGPQTALTAACEQRLGKPVTQAIAQLYQGGSAAIAGFAQVLLQEAAAGDALAVAEARAAAAELAGGIQAAGRMLDTSPKAVATVGGLWQNPFYRSLIQQALGAAYRLIAPTLPPVYGSFVIAAGMAGATVSPETEAAFRASLPM